MAAAIPTQIRWRLRHNTEKMKDCAAKWKDEKAKTGAKGREAYRTYMSGCLKA
jgi:hypothetical protein